MFIEKKIIMENTTPEERAEIRNELKKGKPFKTTALLMIILTSAIIILTLIQMMFLVPEEGWSELANTNSVIGFMLNMTILTGWAYRISLFEEVRE